MSRTVLVTGPGGFVGRHVLDAARAEPGLRLRLLARTPPPDAADGVTYVRGDLADPASLRGVCDGVDAVVHCAALIGGEPERLRAVNDLGTRALAEEARRAGTGRFVHLSTAAVHGRGPFRGVRPGEAPTAPASETSRTRAAAEDHVLAAGGLVLRSHLVYGTGDRWVVPGVLLLLHRLGALPDGWAGRQSAVDAGTLGRALTAAAVAPRTHGGQVRYVHHPSPVPGELLMSAVAEAYGLPSLSATGISAGAARDRVRNDPLARHHLEMLAVDHVFTDDAIWTDLGLVPGAGFAELFPRHAPWYRAQPGQGTRVTASSGSASSGT